MIYRMMTAAVGVMLAAGGCRAAEYSIVEPVENRTIDVAAGDRVTVVLDENCTTGYSWEAKCDDPSVTVEIEHLPPEPPRKKNGPMLCGAPGRAKAVIAVGSGFRDASVVTLSYRRPWSGETAREVVITLK